MTPRGILGGRGFVLVLLLGLLSLLVLLVLALATMSRIDTRIGAVADRQSQARQNALLALDLATAELQRLAGPDDRITAMAGMTGVPAGRAGDRRRHWCGVWGTAGGFAGWLTSGAGAGAAAQLETEVTTVVLVGDGSVGEEALDSEHVVAGRIPIPVGLPGENQPKERGGMAWWIGDEGVKVSTHSPAADSAVPERVPAPGGSPATVAALREALKTHAGRLPEVLSFEQLRLLPVPTSSALAPSVIRDSFHQVTLAARWVDGAALPMRLRSGRVNLNTTSAVVWRSLAETFNADPGQPDIAAGRLAGFAGMIAGGLAASGSGKAPGGPFRSVEGFMAGALLTDALAGSGVKPEEFAASLGPLLAVRSDTFRVRAYGDAVNPATGAIEARGWCEAIVQRLPEAHPRRPGRRFATVYFRWLGPEDI